MVLVMTDKAEVELRRVREQHGILTHADHMEYMADSVRRAIRVAEENCPSGPVVYAAALLGISRSRFRRFKAKFGIGGSDA